MEPLAELVAAVRHLLEHARGVWGAAGVNAPEPVRRVADALEKYDAANPAASTATETPAQPATTDTAAQPPA